MRRLCFIAFVLLLALPAVANPTGEVTISLQEYLNMLKTDDNSPTAPPRPFTFSAAESRVDLAGEWARVQAQCRLEITNQGWQEIPLLSTEAVSLEHPPRRQTDTGLPEGRKILSSDSRGRSPQTGARLPASSGG